MNPKAPATIARDALLTITGGLGKSEEYYQQLNNWSGACDALRQRWIASGNEGLDEETRQTLWKAQHECWRDFRRSADSTLRAIDPLPE